jgi:ABC-2 type transport system ATP-binding protein
MTYIIETQNLTKKFGDLIAVNSINIKVKQGTIHGFIGPNGAGKTTTMKMLIGALRPDKGTAFIKTHKIGSIDSKKIFGFSPQHPKFYENMCGLDYLVYMGRISGMEKKNAQEKAMELLKWLDLNDFVFKKVGGFSAGMKQKLSLAQAMIHEPELLILDEPTANLDPAGRLNIIKKLKQLCKKKKMTVFISSHILSELEKLVDEVTIISKGRIVTESEVKTLEAKFAGNEYLLKTSDIQKVIKKLQSNKFVHKVWLDKTQTIHIIASGDETGFKKNIVKILAKSDATLEAFGISSFDLEKVFMKLVGEKEQKLEKKEKKLPFKIPFFSKKKEDES